MIGSVGHDQTVNGQNDRFPVWVTGGFGSISRCGGRQRSARTGYPPIMGESSAIAFGYRLFAIGKFEYSLRDGMR